MVPRFFLVSLCLKPLKFVACFPEVKEYFVDLSQACATVHDSRLENPGIISLFLTVLIRFANMRLYWVHYFNSGSGWRTQANMESWPCYANSIAVKDLGWCNAILSAWICTRVLQWDQFLPSWWHKTSSLVDLVLLSWRFMWILNSRNNEVR